MEGRSTRVIPRRRWHSFKVARRSPPPRRRATRSISGISGRTGIRDISRITTTISERRTLCRASTRTKGSQDGRWSIATATSNHSGGVNVGFADGSVKFIKDSVNLPTWWALGTRNGGGSGEPPTPIERRQRSPAWRMLGRDAEVRPGHRLMPLQEQGPRRSASVPMIFVAISRVLDTYSARAWHHGSTGLSMGHSGNPARAERLRRGIQEGIPPGAGQMLTPEQQKEQDALVAQEEAAAKADGKTRADLDRRGRAKKGAWWFSRLQAPRLNSHNGTGRRRDVRRRRKHQRKLAVRGAWPDCVEPVGFAGGIRAGSGRGTRRCSGP